MGWDTRYWDIANRFFWTPKYLGLRSLKHERLEREGRCCPRTSIGPIYAREKTFQETRSKLLQTEEALNDIFNVAFAIAPDAAISDFFFKPIGIVDDGPFNSLGDEAPSNLWGEKNVTRPDGLFSSSRSLLAVELKLSAKSSIGQLVKYLFLLFCLTKQDTAKRQLGILFVVPQRRLPTFWDEVGLACPFLDESFFEKLQVKPRTGAIRYIVENHLEDIRATAIGLKLAVVSWTEFRDAISTVVQHLRQNDPGQQTLLRLLSGFRDALDQHVGTGLAPSARDEPA